MTDGLTFGEMIAVLREQEDRTQAELADLCGFGRTSVANIESGFQEPTLARMERLAEALHRRFLFTPGSGWSAQPKPRRSQPRSDPKTCTERNRSSANFHKVFGAAA